MHFIGRLSALSASSSLRSSDGGRPFPISTHPVRDFIFVDDHVDAYRTLIEKKAIGEAFNFCTQRGVSIRELAEIIAGLTRFKGKVEWKEELRRPTEIMKLIGSYDKAKRKLNWRPRYSLEEGLQASIDFWKRKTNPESLISACYRTVGIIFPLCHL